MAVAGTAAALFKRHNYESVDEMVLLGQFNAYSTACCFEEQFRYFFSASFVETSTANSIVVTFLIDLNFCSVYEGQVCKQCFTGYLLDSAALPGNRCLAQDEIPPAFGSDGMAVRACLDPNCLNCRLSYSLCDGCKSGFLHDPVTRTCIDLVQSAGFGLNPSNSSQALLCTDFGCIYG
jgi:hypothetical protein